MYTNLYISPFSFLLFTIIFVFFLCFNKVARGSSKTKLNFSPTSLMYGDIQGRRKGRLNNKIDRAELYQHLKRKEQYFYVSVE